MHRTDHPQTGPDRRTRLTEQHLPRSVAPGTSIARTAHTLPPADRLRALVESSLSDHAWENIDQIEQAYRELPRASYSAASMDALLSLKYLLTSWRHFAGTRLIRHAERGAARDFRAATQHLVRLPWVLKADNIKRLMTAFRRLPADRSETRSALITLLTTQGDPDAVREPLLELGLSPDNHRLGPRPFRRRIRPYSTTRFKSSDQWLRETGVEHTSYRVENEDTIHIRGMRMKTGDVIVADLALAHEGLLNSYVHPRSHYTHSGMFLVVRYAGRHIPAVLEMHERGARLVPLNRFLSPTHTFYGEVYRRVSNPPVGWEAELSQQALHLILENPLSYDFLARPVEVIDQLPRGQQCATCFSLIELMLLRTGVHEPFPTQTRVCEKAIANMLSLLGMADVARTFSNTTEMVRSGASLVGVFDNDAMATNLGREVSIGHIDVEGTMAYQIGTRRLRARNVQDFDWWFSQLVSVSQRNTLAGHMLRSLKGHTMATIPKSATPAAVAFYLAANRRLGPLVQDFVRSSEFKAAAQEPFGCRLETLQRDRDLLRLIKHLMVSHHVDTWF